MSEEKYNGWTNWDTWAVNLVLTNDKRAYNWLQSWKTNFQRKQKRGVFDMVKAELVVSKYLVPVAMGKMRASIKLDCAEPNIDPSKVDKREIVEAILED